MIYSRLHGYVYYGDSIYRMTQKMMFLVFLFNYLLLLLLILHLKKTFVKLEIMLFHLLWLLSPPFLFNCYTFLFWLCLIIIIFLILVLSDYLLTLLIILLFITVYVVSVFVTSLTHFLPIVTFDTTWKYQKT